MHMRADVTKVPSLFLFPLFQTISLLYVPVRSNNRLLSRQVMHASESLLSNNALVSELLHLLVRQFSEVESVGMESTQYRQYIVQIIRLLWNDSRCSQTVIDMKNEPEVIQLFVQTLISSFSKLTDDAFAAIPEIKDLQSLMLQPDFASLDPKERDEKQLRLTQLERNVRFSFDLTTDTLLLLLDAAEPWGVGFSMGF